ncbi:metal-dependent hydrolase [Actinophytocola sp.]|uniref:metal-dependent hydrolase n=1 Tax=Actinophytocola sp. TaxID=1872138 RepID=UPI002D7151F7|nr:metal-dependent hydrolase [Actinophytocola sp.]HYQ62545.1 metal-dependent hydrolase [Actinophytocola sp.]
MAVGHALSGLAAGAALVALAGGGTATAVLAGAVTAGAALLPDLDHPSAIASRYLGWLGEFVGEVLRSLSAATYRATRTPLDRGSDGEHRYLTHTLVFGIAAGAATGVTCVAGGWVAVLVVVAVSVALAVAALGDVVARGVTLAGGAWVAATPDPVAALDELGAAAGVAVAVGCWVHALGDALTESGVPLLWPVPIGGQRWRALRIPEPIRFDVNGPGERWVAWPLLAFACVLAVPGGWQLLDVAAGAVVAALSAFG